jgi:sec-independent protein translocase protein TatB
MGKARAMVTSVKAEIKEELQAEELRQIFKEQADLQEFHAALNETTDAANSIQTSLATLPEETQVDVKPPHEPQ